MSDTTTANRYDALVKVEREAEAVLAATAANEMGAESASVLKHIESIFERAVHEQVKPLEELIIAAQQMIRAQYDHLARIKAEAQALMAAGERANQLSTVISNELTEMRSRHAELVTATTRD